MHLLKKAEKDMQNYATNLFKNKKIGNNFSKKQQNNSTGEKLKNKGTTESEN